jgi:hypothetical protein
MQKHHNQDGDSPEQIDCQVPARIMNEPRHRRVPRSANHGCGARLGIDAQPSAALGKGHFRVECLIDGRQVAEAEFEIK